jgi:hypothetical protein
MAGVTQIRNRGTAGRVCFERNVAEGMTGKSALRGETQDQRRHLHTDGRRRLALTPSVWSQECPGVHADQRHQAATDKPKTMRLNTLDRLKLTADLIVQPPMRERATAVDLWDVAVR